MARKRMIDPHIWEDPGFNGLSLQARLLFIGMVSNADDEGYLRGDAGSLKRLVFGFDDSVTKASVDNWVQEIILLPNIHYYESNGETFIHFTKWDTYQKQQKDRIQASVYPKCSKCYTPAKQVRPEVKGSKGREVKISEGKGSEEGETNSPSPNGSGATLKKDLAAKVTDLSKYAVSAFLFLVLAAHSHALTVEVRTTVSSPYLTVHSRPPKSKPQPALDVPKVAGDSARERKLNPVSSNSQSEDEIINSMRNPDLIRHIYRHESGMGRADICRSMGGFNGFGMEEWPGHRPTCHASFYAVVKRVDDWIEDKKAKGFTLAEMSCFYIRGLKVENCESGYKFQ